MIGALAKIDNLGREPKNLPFARLARVRRAPIRPNFAAQPNDAVGQSRQTHCAAQGNTRTPHHSRCLCSVSLESSSAITIYPIVHALQSKQCDQGDLFL